MPDDPKTDPDAEPDTPDEPVKGDDPDAGAKTALAAERKARREAEKRAKDAEAKAKEFEDKDKSEVERLTEQVATLTRERDAAMVSGARLKVALEKGLTMTQAKRLVGDTEEELSVDADELLEDLGPRDEGDRKTPPPGGKPREQLKPGNGDPDTPVEETDVKAIGARMFQH